MNNLKSHPVLAVRGLRKEFNGTPVLRGVDIDFRGGEVHGLLGENGAGKSTLIKILTGVYSATAGQITVDGKPVSIHRPQDAHHHGVGAVYQDAELMPNLTVAENILLGNEPGRVLVDRRGLFREAQQIVEAIGIDIDVRRLARGLTAAQMQLVSIATLFQRKYRVIILDEPTARLAASEVSLLFTLIERLRAEGIAIIYISHRLDEVKQICQRTTILRGGLVSATLERDEISEERVTELMVDRDRKSLQVRNPGLARDNVVLELQETRNAQLAPVSLQVRAGEVVGIIGPVGGGMEQLEKILGGLTRFEGKVIVNGTVHQLGNPTRSRQAGIALVPEDRRKQALFPNLSVADNITLPVLPRLGAFGFVHSRAKRSYANETIKRLSIKPRIPDYIIKFLSGGNQQKAVIGKWMSAGAAVYIFVEPTSGVDVGAIPEIYETILGLAREGAAVIVISSSLNEILALSQTVMVIRKGEAITKGPVADFDYDQLLSLVMSGKRLPKTSG